MFKTDADTPGESTVSLILPTLSVLL